MQKQEMVYFSLNENGDHRLVQQILAGNQVAFTALVERYSTVLYHFAYRYLGDYEQAYDVVQQVFLKLYIALPHLPVSDQLKPWLFRVTQNCCRDELRRRRRDHSIPFSLLQWPDNEEADPLALLADTKPLPEELAEYHDLQHILRLAIDTLPLKFRSVVLLRYLHRYSFADIGFILEMPMTTAKTYYYRACSKLRVLLQEHIYE
jgi:RNA polymerase sigma-70 factor (ECF subfamily)